MRSKDPLKDTRHSQRAVRGKLIFIIAAAAILEATSLIQTHFANKGMEEEASLRAQTLMEATRLKIMDVIDQAETTVQSMEWAARWGLNHLDTLPALTRLIVQDSPVIIGSTIALVPGYDRRHPLWAPYACESGDSLRVTSLATPEYDYPSQEWFTKPVELGEGYWSEPYLDEGGGNVLMTTYSIPVSDTKGKTAAVLTADISLDWLTSQVGNIEVYPSAFSILVSREGRFMVCPSETMVMQNTLQEAAVRMTDTAAFNAFARDMLAGRSGSRIIPYGKIKEYVYYAPIERTGWSMSVVIPDTEIFEEVKRNARMIGLFQILGLLMLVLILLAIPDQKPDEELEAHRGQQPDGERVAYRPGHPDVDAAQDLPALPRAARPRHVRGDRAGQGGGRRPVRLLHPGGETLFLHRGCQRQGRPGLPGDGGDPQPLPYGLRP